jgi:hypothetical protein
MMKYFYIKAGERTLVATLNEGISAITQKPFTQAMALTHAGLMYYTNSSDSTEFEVLGEVPSPNNEALEEIFFKNNATNRCFEVETLA